MRPESHTSPPSLAQETQAQLGESSNQEQDKNLVVIAPPKTSNITALGSNTTVYGNSSVTQIGQAAHIDAIYTDTVVIQSDVQPDITNKRIADIEIPNAITNKKKHSEDKTLKLEKRKKFLENFIFIKYMSSPRQLNIKDYFLQLKQIHDQNRSCTIPNGCPLSENDISEYLALLKHDSHLDFTGLEFESENSHKRDFKNSNFSNTNFSKSQFSNINLQKASFKHSICTSSKFYFCDLTNSDLEGANFTSATFEGVNFKKANFTKTLLTDAKLSNIKNLKATDLAKARWTGLTISQPDKGAKKTVIRAIEIRKKAIEKHKIKIADNIKKSHPTLKKIAIKNECAVSELPKKLFDNELGEIENESKKLLRSPYFEDILKELGYA